LRLGHRKAGAAAVVGRDGVRAPARRHLREPRGKSTH
jgi:hypothetical protein